MTTETLKSTNPRNRNSISVIKPKFSSVASMNTLLAILKVTDARRDAILAGGLYHRFPWRHLSPLVCMYVTCRTAICQQLVAHLAVQPAVQPDAQATAQLPPWPFYHAQPAVQQAAQLRVTSLEFCFSSFVQNSWGVLPRILFWLVPSRTEMSSLEFC